MPLGDVARYVMFDLGLHKIWRLIPRGLRKRLVGQVARLPQRAARLPRPVAPLIVIGMMRSNTSFGWLARFIADAAAEAGANVAAFDVSAGFSAVDRASIAHRSATQTELDDPATLMIVLTPDQFGYGLSFLPRMRWDNKYVIAYCPWELERLPRDWQVGLAFVDEVWTTSHFVKDAFGCDRPQLPVEVVPCLSPLTDRPEPNRERWSIPSSTFVVMMVFSLRSGMERKNPIASIRAFQNAFAANEDALLLIKASDANLEPEALAELQTAIRSDARIRVVTEALPERDMWAFFAMADVVISLHRAEGFGLVPAQAMMLGKPVVATGWSSVLDFMSAESAMLIGYELKPVEDRAGRYPVGQVWAEPDVDEAAAALQSLYRNPERRVALGAAGRRAIETFIAAGQTRFRDLVGGRFASNRGE